METSAREGSSAGHPLVHDRRCSDVCAAASPSPPRSRSVSPTGPDNLTLRALVSTKDAGIIIGKAGKNVADLRDQTGVKAGVSKVVPGVMERVLTISGPVDRVAKVFVACFSICFAI
jgi:heterogeneous nuclear rnp K-like protein 2